MEFEHEPHPRTGTMMLKSDEVLVETLEDNQVQLQNLMMSKYLSHFLKEVTSWQQKLSTADSVISIWFEVQRTWSHLESIFIGSEDIRAQLPEDSKRFDTIDQEFKVSSDTGYSQKWLLWTAWAPILLFSLSPPPPGLDGRCRENAKRGRSHQQTGSLQQTGEAEEEVGPHPICPVEVSMGQVTCHLPPAAQRHRSQANNIPSVRWIRTHTHGVIRAGGG